MSNVIKPEQIKSSRTPQVGEIPVIDDSTSLVVPDSITLTLSGTKFENNGVSGYLRLSSIVTNSDVVLVLRPNGTSTSSSIRLRNSSNNSAFGYVDIKLNGLILNIQPGNSGGTLPTTIQWNGGKIWHEGNDGSGSGLDADTIRTFIIDQNLRSTDSPTFSKITSLSIATGTAPITVTSTTVCPNLNSSFVDGFGATTNPTAGSIISVLDSAGNLKTPNNQNGGKLKLGYYSAGDGYGYVSVNGTTEGLKFETINSGTPVVGVRITSVGNLEQLVSSVYYKVLNLTDINTSVGGIVSRSYDANLGQNAADYTTSCYRVKLSTTPGYPLSLSSGLSWSPVAGIYAISNLDSTSWIQIQTNDGSGNWYNNPIGSGCMIFITDGTNQRLHNYGPISYSIYVRKLMELY